MSAYDPSFEIELSPDLTGDVHPAIALRAVYQIPYQNRMHGLRAMMFFGSHIATRDPQMRDGALQGVRRALSGYDIIFAFLTDWASRSDLQPEVRAVLERTRDDQAEAVKALVSFRAILMEGIAALEGEEGLTGEGYDALIAACYNIFHPAMTSLGQKMTEAGDHARVGLEQAADVARKRAVESRTRINSIARTVRLISLNARVEAARAGDSGRAFGVIAEEIKVLAEQTEKASSELGDSVEEIMRNFRVA